MDGAFATGVIDFSSLGGDGKSLGGGFPQADAVVGSVGEAEERVVGRTGWRDFGRELGDTATIEVG